MVQVVGHLFKPAVLAKNRLHATQLRGSQLWGPPTHPCGWKINAGTIPMPTGFPTPWGWRDCPCSSLLAPGVSHTLEPYGLWQLQSLGIFQWAWYTGGRADAHPTHKPASTAGGSTSLAQLPLIAGSWEAGAKLGRGLRCPVWSGPAAGRHASAPPACWPLPAQAICFPPLEG